MIRHAVNGFGALSLSLLAVVPAAAAQDRPTIEFEAGLGRTIDLSSEASLPETSTTVIGVSYWFSGPWGVSVAGVIGHGFSLIDPPVEIQDRVFLGTQDLRYVRVTARYRRAISDSANLIAGVGLVPRGSYEDVELRKTPSGLLRAGQRLNFGAFSGELYLEARLTRNLALRVGSSTDMGPEARLVQPVFVGVLSF